MLPPIRGLLGDELYYLLLLAIAAGFVWAIVTIIRARFFTDDLGDRG